MKLGPWIKLERDQTEARSIAGYDPVSDGPSRRAIVGPAAKLEGGFNWMTRLVHGGHVDVGHEDTIDGAKRAADANLRRQGVELSDAS